jgi:hypothetical protein
LEAVSPESRRTGTGNSMRRGRAARAFITDNPVIWREARLRFWREWSRLRKVGFVVGAAAILALLAFASRRAMGNAPLELRQALVMVYGMALGLGGAIIGARSVAGEREVRTWEQLLITRLRPVHLILGKIVGVMWQVGMLALVAAPALWIWVMYFAPPPAYSRTVPYTIYGYSYAQRPPLTELLFAPGGFGGTTQAGSALAAGFLWLFSGAMLWMAQGATAGVFASLRYRSTITAIAVAVVFLAVVLMFDFLMLMGGGAGLASSPWIAYGARLLRVPVLLALGGAGVVALFVGFHARYVRKAPKSRLAVGARNAALGLGLACAVDLFLGWIATGVAFEETLNIGLGRLVAASILVVWVWPCITIAIMLGLATYEFREFDRWLDAGRAAAGS